MDPQHQQWRPRPPIPGTLCPICSISHFPFCPPPPPSPFPQNPIFPHHSPNSFQRSGLDPYTRPIGTNTPAPFPNQTPWQRNPNFGYGNFQGFAPPPPPPPQPQPPPPPPPPYEYGGNGYVNDGDRSFKRARMDDFGSGPGFESEFNPNNVGNLSEDERRLKLIHDHGGGAGLVSGSNQGCNGETNRHSQQESGKHVNNNVQNNGNVGLNSLVNEPQHSHWQPHPSNAMQRHSAHLKHDFHAPGHQHGGYFHPPAGHMPALRPISGQPPLPVTPPPPLPSKPPASLFPVHVGSSPMMSTAYQPSPEAAHHSMPPQPPYFHSKPFSHVSTGYVMEFPKESHVFHQALPKQYVGEGQPFPQKRSSLDKPKVIDALHLFKQPHRVTRPDHFVIILRGLPGTKH